MISPKKKMSLYQLATLRKTSAGWHIEFRQTDPLTGNLERIRKTYGLNRIKNKKERRKRAAEIISELNTLIPHGHPYEDNQLQAKTKTPAIDAIKLGVEWKSMCYRRKSSLASFLPVTDRFQEFIIINGYDQLDIGHINHSIILEFLNHYKAQGISPVAYNNYRTRIYGIFKELKTRDYIEVNPFDKIEKMVEPKKKQRRYLNDNQKQQIFQYALSSDPLLAICIILLYYCAIRPREQRRLRRSDIDLKNGVINISSEQSKNWDNEIITIPEEIIPVLSDLLENAPFHSYILGANWRFADKPCGKNTPNYHHRKALKHLLRYGKIISIEGISLYSWKDTAAMDLVGKMNIFNLMKHFRHKDLSYTQKYLDNLPKKNDDIAKVQMGIKL